MRIKIYDVLRRLYGLAMTAAFFGGAIPLIPFIYAMAVGGETGEAIALFIKNRYYPIVIALASIAVIIGLIAMYMGAEQGLSVKKMGNDTGKNKKRQ